ncbi:hypothetical protein BC940DRAFT_336761 [Gongronella butleri]|nr:hypothetical protein BC940DRAFT_336761 [Gongronella butleri]
MVSTQSNTITNTAMDPKSVLVENTANINDPSNRHQAGNAEMYAQVSNSPPMAVLPLNSSAKLELEPNPFEQSFSTVSKRSLTPEPEDSSKAKAKIKHEQISQQKQKQANGPHASSNATANTKIAPATASTTAAAAATSTSEPLKLPPVAAMTSPNPLPVISSVPKDIANQYAWDSLRAGPLSPSMLQRPANPDDFAMSNINPANSMVTSYQNSDYSSTYQNQQGNYPSSRLPHTQKQSPLTRDAAPRKNSNAHDSSESSGSMSPQQQVASPPQKKTTTGQRRKKEVVDKDDDLNDLENDTNGSSSNKKQRRGDEEDEKRRNFLERNRLAALKCRQRKKQWLNNLQAKVEFLTNDNERLQMETTAMRDEIMQLKSLLLQHKDCPVSQANGFPDLTNNAQKHPSAPPPPPHAHHHPPMLHPTSSAPPPTVSMPIYSQPTASLPAPPNHSQSVVPQPLQQQRLPATTTTTNMVLMPQQVTAAIPSSGVLQF